MVTFQEKKNWGLYRYPWDETVASESNILFFFFLTGGKDILLTHYGPSWKLHRKLFTTALRQYLSDIPLIERRVLAKAEALTKYIETLKGKPFDPSESLNRTIADVICGITFGEGYDTTNPNLNRLLKLNVDFVSDHETAQLVKIMDFFPVTQYLPIKAYDRFIQPFYEMFDIIRIFLREREKNFDPEKPIQDLVSGLILAKKRGQTRKWHGKVRLSIGGLLC